MKLISFILSVIILLGALSTCSDSFENSINNKESFIVQGNQPHHSHSDADNCSPFCICQCCQSPVLVIKLALESLIIKVNTNYKFKHIQKVYPNNFISGIWNPPEKS